MICSRAEILAILGIGSTASNQDLAYINMLHPWTERLIKDFVGGDIESGTYTEWYPDRGLYTPLDMLIEGYEGASGRAVPIERFRSDNRLLQLRHLPARAVTSVYEDPAAWDNAVNGVPVFSAGSQLHEGSDWMLDYKESTFCWSGFLFRRTGVWTQQERAIQVTYTAGYTAAELSGKYSRFKRATIAEMVRVYGQFKSQRPNVVTGAAGGAITGEGMAGWTVSMDAESARINFGLQSSLAPETVRILEEHLNYAKYI